MPLSLQISRGKVVSAFLRASPSSLKGTGIVGREFIGTCQFRPFSSRIIDSTSTPVGESREPSQGFAAVLTERTILACSHLKWSLKCSTQRLSLCCLLWTTSLFLLRTTSVTQVCRPPLAHKLKQSPAAIWSSCYFYLFGHFKSPVFTITHMARCHLKLQMLSHFIHLLAPAKLSFSLR